MKSELNIGIVGPFDAGQIEVIGSIYKTLTILKNSKPNPAFVALDRLPENNKYGSQEGSRYESLAHVYVLFQPPSWKFKYGKFIYEIAKLFSGVILVISATEPNIRDPQLSKDLDYFRMLGISKMIILISRQKSEEDQSKIGFRKSEIQKLLLSKGFQADRFPVITYDIWEAVWSKNLDPTAPEYQPTLNLLQLIEDTFVTNP